MNEEQIIASAVDIYGSNSYLAPQGVEEAVLGISSLGVGY